MTATFRAEIEGMSCASCVRRVETALQALPGVVAARANLATNTVEADYDGEVTPAQLMAALDSAGYPAVTEKHRFSVEGLSCASCVRRLEMALAEVPGVAEVSVNLADQTATHDTTYIFGKSG